MIVWEHHLAIPFRPLQIYPNIITNYKSTKYSLYSRGWGVNREINVEAEGRDVNLRVNAEAVGRGINERLTPKPRW